MPAAEFLPLDPSAVDVKSFDCGKDAISTYLHRYAAKNMVLNLSRDLLLSHAPDKSARKLYAAAYHTLAHQVLTREEPPTHPACHAIRYL